MGWMAKHWATHTHLKIVANKWTFLISLLTERRQILLENIFFL